MVVNIGFQRLVNHNHDQLLEVANRVNLLRNGRIRFGERFAAPPARLSISRSSDSQHYHQEVPVIPARMSVPLGKEARP